PLPLSEPNVGVVIQTRGDGAIMRTIPDGTEIGGDCRGAQATDWQAARSLSSQVASGRNSTISGGLSNTSSGTYSTVGGGLANVASGISSVVSGGFSNTASAAAGATVGGGELNTADGLYSVVSGGISNITSGRYSTIA